MEEFRKIEEYRNYSVSNYGRVRNDKTGRFLKYYKKPSGYLQVQLGRKAMPQYVHRLVAKAFIPNTDNKPQVNHIDGNKQNNKVENLEWITARDNYFGFGYESRKMNKYKKVIARNIVDGSVLEFNSREETAEYFKCNKSNISYNHLYEKGNKKDWIFELKI